MFKKLKSLKFGVALLLSITLTLGLSISLQSLLATWTAPGANPPTNNINDLNIGGGLSVGENIAVTGNILATGDVAAVGKIIGTEVCIGGTCKNAWPVNGTVTGGGTTNYIARYTPDGITLGNSIIQDDGSKVGINTAPDANAELNVNGGIKVSQSGLGWSFYGSSGSIWTYDDITSGRDMLVGRNLKVISGASLNGNLYTNGYTTFPSGYGGGIRTWDLAAGGSVLAQQYCDQNGANCRVITAMGGGVTGSGIANKIPMWGGTTLLGNSNISQDGAGNIAIGPITPQARLDVNGNIKITAENSTLTLGGAAYNYARIQLANWNYLQSTVGDLFIHSTNLSSDAPFVITNSWATAGLVYKKTGSKDARITVQDPTRAWSMASGWNIGGDFSIIEEGVAGDRFYIKQGTGNVGIGVSGPVQKLDVAGYIKGNGFCIGASCITSWPGGGTAYTAGTGISISGTTISSTVPNCGIATLTTVTCSNGFYAPPFRRCSYKICNNCGCSGVNPGGTDLIMASPGY